MKDRVKPISEKIFPTTAVRRLNGVSRSCMTKGGLKIVCVEG